jgi:hypothetical protein
MTLNGPWMHLCAPFDGSRAPTDSGKRYADGPDAEEYLRSSCVVCLWGHSSERMTPRRWMEAIWRGSSPNAGRAHVGRVGAMEIEEGAPH